MAPIAETLGAVKLGVDTLTALKNLFSSLMNDLKLGNLSKDEFAKTRQALDLVKLTVAEKAAVLGYPSCNCLGGPHVMTKVGHRMPENESDEKHLASTVSGGIARGSNSIPVAISVHECPACGQTDAFSKGYFRFAPPRQSEFTITFVEASDLKSISSFSIGGG